MTDFLLPKQLYGLIKGIPGPRLMHRKGIAAEGFFRSYISFEDYTEAEIFNKTDESFPVNLRFSSMIGEKGRADTMRNIKGMSLKFHTQEGPCDMICHNLPVFFINSEDKLMDMFDIFTNRTKLDGINEYRLWKFAVDNPESINCILRLFSYKGLSDSFLKSEWYSTNTYIWENKFGEKFLVRYKWIPVNNKEIFKREKASELDRISAEFMAGFDPDIAIEELSSRIDDGDFPSFELTVQIVDHKYISHPNYLKQTLAWNEHITPPITAGIIKLTGIIQCENEGEMISFAPGNLINGISICSDGLSQAFDYIYRTECMERGGAL